MESRNDLRSNAGSAPIDPIQAVYVIAGVFAGSTPDPASWHYNPNQRLAGSFVNVEGGSFDSFHYTSTIGIAVSTLKWRLDRPFIFLENGISYGNSISVYHSLIADGSDIGASQRFKARTAVVYLNRNVPQSNPGEVSRARVTLVSLDSRLLAMPSLKGKLLRLTPQDVPEDASLP
jgi:hypothetical protein